MRWRRALVGLGLMVVGLLPAAPAGPAPAPGDVEVCPEVPPGYARCLSELHSASAEGASTDGASASALEGLRPKQVKNAYGWPTGDRVGKGERIVITSAFHAPTLQKDLRVFSDRFGLPRCTVGNGCLQVVSADPTADPPPVDPGWALESTLDVQWVHAIAPSARIVLVEAKSNAFADMLQAVDVAAAITTTNTGGRYVSNSWGAAQISAQGLFDHHFTDTPGISWFFGSGDDGAPALYPAASPYVVSVGGTRFKFDDSGQFKKEIGWTGSGGGCSPYSSASAAQVSFAQYAATGCAGARAVPDLAALADPATGVAIYTSTPVNGFSGWLVIGGTSLSGPLVAARAAITGGLVDQALVYGNTITFRDVKDGNNGLPAGPGYDLVTGRGSWIG